MSISYPQLSNVHSIPAIVYFIHTPFAAR
jgi:hypothetical protein